MPYKDLTEVNITSLGDLFVYISGELNMFIPLLFISLFFISLLASYYSQLRMRGYANFWGSLAVSSFVTTISMLFLSFVPDLINPFYLLISIGVTFVSVLLLLLLVKDNE